MGVQGCRQFKELTSYCHTTLGIHPSQQQMMSVSCCYSPMLHLHTWHSAQEYELSYNYRPRVGPDNIDLVMMVSPPLFVREKQLCSSMCDDWEPARLQEIMQL
jgi:hypothetical protein